MPVQSSAEQCRAVQSTVQLIGVTGRHRTAPHRTSAQCTRRAGTERSAVGRAEDIADLSARLVSLHSSSFATFTVSPEETTLPVVRDPELWDGGEAVAIVS